MKSVTRKKTSQDIYQNIYVMDRDLKINNV